MALFPSEELDSAIDLPDGNDMAALMGVVPLVICYAANLSEGEADLTGAFKVLFHGQDTNAVEHIAVDAEFHGDGTVSGGVSGSFEAGESLILNLDGVEYRGVYCNGYDSDQDAFVTNFTAMSQDGQTVWGVRTAGQD